MEGESDWAKKASRGDKEKEHNGRHGRKKRGAAEENWTARVSLFQSASTQKRKVKKAKLR